MVAQITPSIKVLGIDLSAVDTTQKHELGLEVNCNDGTRRRYVKATTTVAQFDACTQTIVNNVIASTTAASQPVVGINVLAGVSGAASFFWLVVRALTVVVKAATVAALAPLVSTGTSGTLDDTAASAANALAAASGAGVWSLTVDGTPAAGQATVSLL